MIGQSSNNIFGGTYMNYSVESLPSKKVFYKRRVGAYGPENYALMDYKGSFERKRPLLRKYSYLRYCIR